MPGPDSSSSAASASPPPWEGLLERHAFPPFLTAVLAVVVTLILYQLIGTIALLVLLLQEGVGAGELVPAMEQLFAERAEAVLTTNALAQVLGLALPAFLFARLHTARVGPFLRLRPPDPTLLGLALVGLVGLTPVVLWLGAFNESLPIPQPEWMRELEEAQVELLEQVLRQDASLVLNLLLMAVTPAFCEEVLFRGYVQRQAERGLGVAGGLLFSGIVFGFYHFRLSQVIPLSVLGLYMAYLVWRTRSLWPAVVVHFANNALAVWLSPYLEEAEGEVVETMSVPWYFVGGGLLLVGLVLYTMHRAAARPAPDRVPSEPLTP